MKLGKDKHHNDIVSCDVGIYHINLLNRLLVGYCPGIAFVIRHRLLGDQFTQINPGNWSPVRLCFLIPSKTAICSGSVHTPELGISCPRDHFTHNRDFEWRMNWRKCEQSVLGPEKVLFLIIIIIDENPWVPTVFVGWCIVSDELRYCFVKMCYDDELKITSYHCCI